MKRIERKGNQMALGGSPGGLSIPHTFLCLLLLPLAYMYVVLSVASVLN
jgi:hypothetical protein